MKIYLLRHGKTAGNALFKYIGRTDEEVSEEGIKELEKKDKIKVDIAFCSPKKRCLQTAKIMVESAGGVEVCESLAECDFGIFENKNYKELENCKEYQDWIESDCKSQIPDGECMQSFCDRTISGFYSCIEKARNKNASTVAIVCHGGSIMAITQSLFGGDFYSRKVENGGMVVLEV